MDQLAPESPNRKPRRRYSAEFKAMVVDTCNDPGQSVASVAQKYELNANLLHKWRRHHNVDRPVDFIRLPAPAKPIHCGNALQSETVQINLPCGITVYWPMDHISSSVCWLKSLMP